MIRPAQPRVEKLVARAEAALDVPITSVMDKTGVAASGDPHDYLTIAPYFWPDPTKLDGLPFIKPASISKSPVPASGATATTAAPSTVSTTSISTPKQASIEPA